MHTAPIRQSEYCLGPNNAKHDGCGHKDSFAGDETQKDSSVGDEADVDQKEGDRELAKCGDADVSHEARSDLRAPH